MKIYLAALATILLPTLCCAQTDPFEPDDELPFLGATMDGGRPDFTEPPIIFFPVDGWVIEGRQLDSSLDVDWMVFNDADYISRESEGEIRVIPTNSHSQANLRVEILGYDRDSILDPSPDPLVLQSCANAPTGTTIISLIDDLLTDRDDFRAFYRLRSCNGASDLGYRFEYRIANAVRVVASATVAGEVRSVTTGKTIDGTYIFTNENTATFGSPATGKFEFFVTSTNDLLLDFLAGGISSLGPVNIGRVDPFDSIQGVTLWGQPTGLIFFSGFE